MRGNLRVRGHLSYLQTFGANEQVTAHDPYKPFTDFTSIGKTAAGGIHIFLVQQTCHIFLSGL
jgi:hypothetical protein